MTDADATETPTPVYVVPDTSVHLHALPFTDIDWRALADADRVVVVVPRQVQRELDKHKDEHRLPHMKDRARAAIALVRALRAAAGAPPRELRSGVTLVYDPAAPAAVDMAARRLDPERPDDVILAAAVAWRDTHPGARTLVLTRDGGMEFGAADLGLETMLLPPALERPAERDPRDAELAELRKQVARYQARVPELRVHLGEGRVHLHAPIHFGPLLSEGDVEHVVAAATAKYPARDGAADAERETLKKARDRERAQQIGLSSLADLSLGALWDRAGRNASTASDDEYARYERERLQYPNDYRRYVTAAQAYQMRLALTVPLTVVVENTGMAPADDVRLTLTIPPSVRVETEETRPGPPHPPPEPVPPRTVIGFVPGFGSTSRPREPYVPRLAPSEAERARRTLGSLSGALAAPWAVRIEATADGTVVTKPWPKIQQDDRTEIALLLTFASPEAVSPFAISYELRADHLPVQRGELHVVARVLATP